MVRFRRRKTKAPTKPEPTRKGFHPKTRRMGGLNWRLVGVFTTKTKATKESDFRRKSGLRTSVSRTSKVKKAPLGAFGGTTKGRYAVYKRPR